MKTTKAVVAADVQACSVRQPGRKRMTMTKDAVRRSALGMLAWVLLAPASAGIVMDPIRIVVFPFHTGEGAEARDAGEEARHARYLSRHIDRRLARHGFEVIDPLEVGPTAMEEVYGCLTTRWREGSLEDCLERAEKVMARADLAYLVWLDVTTHGADEGRCTARVRVEVEGFDRGRRDFGVGLMGFTDTFEMTRSTCEVAIRTAEVKVAGDVGRLLGGWHESHLDSLRRPVTEVVRPEGRARERASRAGEAPTVLHFSAPASSAPQLLSSLSARRFAQSAGDSRASRYRDDGRDRFADFDPNPVKVVAEEPVSTFSIDVDTASYSFVRAALNRGEWPPHDAVRVEELVNYFPYDYETPEDREAPFAAAVSLMPAPWNAATRLMHIGIRGYAPDPGARPRANLVFLVDSSGSMDAPNKLPLLVSSLKLLLQALHPDDTVAIVTYAGTAGIMLEPTRVAERSRILATLERLTAGGSTAGAEGIRQAYRLAGRHFAADRVNRVLLATDGDFNVGITDLDALEGFIARKRAGGVFLSVLGFGMGNYDDALMQRLAQHGNGHAAYIDTLSEARKVLVEEATSTLFPIAKDVKIQVEFNPAMVSEYRLIGYETRMLAREDFSNDKVDAGEIGAGHTVTALYELTSAGSGAERIEPLRYQAQAGAQVPATDADFAGEHAFVKIRYKLPDSDASTLITRPVTRADEAHGIEAAPREARFAVAVAGFGQLLRGGRYTGDYGFDDVIALAQGARGEDRFGYRAEFVRLVRLAESSASLER